MLSALFVVRSIKAPEPLIEMRLFKDRKFSVSSIGIFLTGATLYGTKLLLPFYYQIVLGDPAWKAGLLMAPQGVGAAVVMRYAGSLSDRRGPRYVAAIGMSLLALGTLAYTGVTATSSYVVLAGALFVRGIGLGFGIMPVFAASYRDLTHADVPKATSATSIVRQIGGSLGVAIFAVVLQTQIAQRFPTTGAALQSGLIGPTLHDLQGIEGPFRHSF